MKEAIRFLDLRITDKTERAELLAACENVFNHGRIVLGPEVEAFERTVARRVDKRHAIGVGSGSDAVYLGLRALGIGPGDEVITGSLSWIATANGIALTGATPVFADIGDDLNIDPTSVRQLVSPRTRAVLAVHYTGRPCEMDELVRICEQHQLFLVEDAAQAFGARYQGRPVGSFGALACFSMNPMKVLASLGEAGIVATDVEAVAANVRSLRYNGTVNREECLQPSINGRIDTLQAAFLLVRMRRFEAVIGRRREIAAFYRNALRGLVDTPGERHGDFNVYYTYTIQADDRDGLKRYLEDRHGIECKIQHPILMPDQPPYREKPRADYRNARRLRERILCIPAHEKMVDEQASRVAEAIRAYYGTGR
jgi:dTDP-4-amino-4,6-dideoxygalactose transaminase